MLTLRIVQADFGDSFILAFGTPPTPRYLLVDGGPSDVYANDLRATIEQLAADGRRLELVIVSHVDNDHIVGLLDLFAELDAAVQAGDPPLIEVGGLWFNSFANAVDRGSGVAGRISAALSTVNALQSPNANRLILGIGEGNHLRIGALQLDIPINEEFPGNLVCVDDAPDPIEIDNLTIRVVGPTRANLDALQAEWENWLDEHDVAFATADPKLMRNADKSVPNLSSIMLHVESDGKTILFTGDGRSDHLLDGLEAADLLDDNGHLHVDVLKVAHHGSDRNATRTFFRKVTADTYVISANGNPDNPDLATLIWIVETAAEAGRPIRIMATNPTPSLDKLVQEYPPQDYGYTLDIMPPDAHSWDLELS